MKNIKFLIAQCSLMVGTSIASVALLITSLNVNSACFYHIHQPPLPNNVDKLRRIK